ncbi:MAG: type II toxin-antitoxin system PemK/MazF family toxin [Candidatus Omnitrophota bacterium]|nr:type II toxin-antitoxin system PemK/MazF family toxin [Candidatus Omnitrophota bacterium]
MQINYPKRGEVYNLPFSQSHGSEMQDKHPAVVVQNDKANRFSGFIIVVPITGTLKVADLPIGVKIMPLEGGLTKPSVVHCGHIYTVNKSEFTADRFRGTISVEKMLEINKALKISLVLI